MYRMPVRMFRSEQEARKVLIEDLKAEIASLDTQMKTLQRRKEGIRTHLHKLEDEAQLELPFDDEQMRRRLMRKSYL